MRHRRIEDPETWDQMLLQLPKTHLLQSWGWGELKTKYGWLAERWLWEDEEGTPIAAAQVLFRSVGRMLTMAYAPRAPLLTWDEGEKVRDVLKDLIEHSAAQGAFFLKIDPEIREETTGDQKIIQTPAFQPLIASGWRLSEEQVQFRNTLVLDLTQDDDSLLAGMKQKTRYNVRLAGRRGVIVREGSPEDFDLLYRMYAETSVRDGFVIRPQAYYEDAWGLFMQRGQAAPLIAEVEGEAIAALVVYRFGKTAYYLYGMSRDAHREKMPTYLLQWEAIRWAKRQGCETYDFWGAPHEIGEEDPMYGVYRFKLGFGARVVRTPGAWDYPIRPLVYRLYTNVMPAVLGLMRNSGRARLRAQVQDT